MPWRLRPRAAVSVGLLSGLMLIAVSGLPRAPEAPLDPRAHVRPSHAGSMADFRVGAHPARRTSDHRDSPAARRGIDDTLTLDADGCARIGATVWHPLSGVEYTGQLRAALPPAHQGALVLYVGDAVPLDIEALNELGEPAVIRRERLPPGPGVQVPPDFWLDDQAPWNAPREITRVTIDARSRPRLLVVRLGRRAPRVLARLTGYSDDVRVRVCAAPVGPGERYFGTGWYGEERTPDGAVRWMREIGAVMIGSDHGRAVRLRVRAAPAAGGAEPVRLAVRVNDVHDLAPVAMRRGFAEYEWAVPDAAWVAGTNELLFSVSRTERRGTRALGLALASLHVQ